MCNATQITCWTFVPRTACSAVCRNAAVKCGSVVEAAAAEGSKQLLSSSGNTNASQKYLGKGKIVHGPSCSGEDYKSSLSAGGCLEIHNPKLLAGSSALFFFRFIKLCGIHCPLLQFAILFKPLEKFWTCKGMCTCLVFRERKVISIFISL